jgi:hypothetical protein
MRSGEGADEKGEGARRGARSPIDHEPEPESLSWAVRWVNNSTLRKSLPDPSLEHLFRC